MGNAYLKYLIKAYELTKNKGAFTPKSLGDALGVKRSTAFEYIQKLVKAGYVIKSGKRYLLTGKGFNEARRIIRNHRIIETLLYRNGIDLQRACEYAYRIQDSFDDEAIEKIFMKIGCPKFCPHGREIPHVRSTEGGD